jgi:hypothetical protein
MILSRAVSYNSRSSFSCAGLESGKASVPAQLRKIDKIRLKTRLFEIGTG